MNKIYKLKFDKRRNELVVVSEITAGMGKEKNTGHIADLSALSPFRKLLGTLTPLALLTGLIISLFPGMALANPDLPTGGQIVGGQGSISTSGNQMTIHQQTQNMATNWHSFDVGQNNTVQFVQPDSSSVALNRVTGASGSQIMGTLKANGQVFILNPNGVLFGKNARVNVAGLVASTKNINTADFMKGQYTLGGSGSSGAQVVNQGSLTTSKGGYIVLAGERVSNSGTVTTPDGKTVLAAGKTVTLQLDNGGLTSVSVNGSVVNALVENRGLISATNGQVYLTAKGQDMLLNTVVNNSGTVEARGLESRGGEIVLNGGDSGVVSQSGQLLADSQAELGGKITLEGENIHLVAGSRSSASGKTGGGEVYVGGGWQGKDSQIRNASKVVMDKFAIIDVSATENGNGGTAVLWSDDYTSFRGTIQAKGGSRSGHGGQVETSSHDNLQAFGDVDTSAPAGKGGNWLLDPLDVTIVSGASDSNIAESGKGTETTLDTDTDHIFSPSATGAQVSAQKIADQLNAGTDVTVDTRGEGEQAGNIVVNADIKKTEGSDATLTLKADGNIIIGDNSTVSGRDRTISSAGNGEKLGLKLLAGGSGANGKISLGRNVNISLNGGDFYAGPAETENSSPSVSLDFLNNGQIQAGNITMDVAGGMDGKYNSLIADDDLTINGQFTYLTGWGRNTNITAGDKLKLNAASGNITFRSTDVGGNGNPGGGKILISGKNGVDINASNGQMSFLTNAGDKFGIDIRSDGEVKIHAGSGNISLTNGTLSTKGNIVLATDTGTITLSGANALLNSSSGNISMVSENSIYITGGAHIQAAGELSVLVNNKYNINNARLFNVINSGLSGSNLNISVNGNVSPYYSLLFLSNSSFSGKDILINATGNGRGAEVYYLNKFKGNLTLSTNSTSPYSSDAPASIFLGGGSRIEVDGNADISSHVNGQGGKGAALFLSGGINVSGDLALTGVSGDDGVGIISVQSNKEIKADGNITISGGSNGGVGVLITKGKIKGDNVVVNGTSTTGSGVYISDGVVLNNAEINGGSDSGIGVLVAGNASLNTASVNGTSASGTGTNINGCLTVSGTSDIKGTSTSGTGLNIGKTVTVAEADRDNITFTGISTDKAGVILGGSMNGGSVIGTSISGDGIVLADNAVVTDASLKGSSTNGSGVSVTGNISLDDTTAAGLNATSVSGAGLSLENNVNVSVVNITTVTQEKHDANGNPVIDVDGQLVMETVTTTKPVTTPVILTGTSQNGSGVITSGNVSISGVILNGSATTAEGIGATLGGNLTISDNISGVTVNATGNGTALVVDNVTINADGYTETGKDFVINASTSDSDGTAIKTQGNNQLGDVTLNATASNGGTAVELGGQVSGGQITGTSDSGQSVVVSDGTNLDSTDVKGHSGSGTGLNVSGNVSLSNAVLIGTTETGTGSQVVAGAKVASTGTSVLSGEATGTGNGMDIQGEVTGGKVAGVATSGTALTLADGAAVVNADVTGTATEGTGTSVNGSVTLADSSASGETVTGTGVLVLGNLRNSGDTTVTGTSAGSGTGTLLSGNVTGGVVNGNSADGVGVSIDRDITLQDVAVRGASVSQSGVLVSGNVSNVGTTEITGRSERGPGVTLNGTVSGGILDGHSASGAGLHVTGDSQVNDVVVRSSSDAGTSMQVDGNLSSAGSSLNGRSLLGTAVETAIRQAANQEQAVVSQSERLKRPSVASGYRELDKTISVEICTEGQCRKLDVGPSSGSVSP
ncbi:TPA: filamentous hemagglutinin N-terminal domain-containing protein [Salmonella enterica]|nr:filamentous hemagglutinin N-terminal domain-containing protein [Salmonella enterica]